MNMTSEQRNLLKVIMDNKAVLEELLKCVCTQKQVKNLQIEDSITVAGVKWSKFAEDGEGNAYMLADKSVCNMEFGDNNDWRESKIRENLQNELYPQIRDELGENALVTIQTDLFSHDGLRDYGKCADMISLLTYDFYRNNRRNIKNSNELWWTSTPDSTLSGYDSRYVQCVCSDGYVGCGGCFWRDVGVRPFFILKSDIFVSCENVEEHQ